MTKKTLKQKTTTLPIYKVWWQSFQRTSNTKYFFEIFSPWTKWFVVLALVFLVIGSIWGLAFAPMDYLQGNSYRIIFIHVPSASLALSIYFMLALLSGVFLVLKIKTASILAQALAPVGLVMCVVALCTGSIWGKPTWGTYWEWDARLTSMLILAFLYVGVLGLFSAYEQDIHRGKAAAVLCMAGVVMLPIIRYSVAWWNTLHQPSTFSIIAAPKMPPSMYTPLIMMLLGFYCLAIALGLYRSCTLILKRDQNKKWVQDYCIHKQLKKK